MDDSSRQSEEINLAFWNERWQMNKIGFHRTVVSELANAHLIPKLVSSEQQQCVLFTLCGKTLDMKAVADSGHCVIGIEGSQIGVEAFFKENNIPYEIEKDDDGQCLTYKSTDRALTIYCSDFFNFNRTLPPVDYIWDRGGLVAISPTDREKYRDVLVRMMTPDRTKLLLVAINYDDPMYTPPPHVVDDEEVKRLFVSECSTELVQVHDETDEFNSRNSRKVKFIEERLHLIIRKQK